MATSSRDAKLTLSIESLGQENITKLEKELRRLADTGDASAAEFGQLADEISRLGDQNAALQGVKALADQTAALQARQEKAGQTAQELAQRLETLRAATDQVRAAQDTARQGLLEGEKTYTEAGNALRALKAEYDNAGKQTTEYRSRLQALVAAQNQANLALVTLRDENRRASEAVTQAAADQRKAEGAYKAAERQVAATAAAVEKQGAAMREAGAAADALGVDVSDLAGAEAALQSAFTRATKAAQDRKVAIDDMAEADRLAATEAKGLAELYARGEAALLAETAALREAAKSAMDYAAAKARATANEEAWQREADAIVSMRVAQEQSTKRTQEQVVALRELSAQNAFAKQAAEAQKMVQAAEYVRFWEQALDAADRKQQELTANTQRVNDAFKQINVRPIEEIQREIASTNAAMATLAASGKVTGSALAVAMQQAETKVQSLERELRQVSGTMTLADKAAGLLKNSMGQITAGNLIADGIGYLVNKVKEMGAAAIAAIIQLDQMRRGLNAIYKDTGTTASQIIFLNKTARDAGVAVGSLGGEFVRFSAAMHSANIPLEQSNALFAAVTKAAATLGLDAEATAGSLNALGQMASKGVVSMEELRQQLGDRLPGALGLVAKGMGLTQAQLISLVESGKLATRDFVEPFTQALKGLHGESTGIIPAWNDLKNMLTALAQSLGDAGGTNILTAAIRALSLVLGLASVAVGGLVEVFGALIRSGGVLAAAVITWTNPWTALKDIWTAADDRVKGLTQSMVKAVSGGDQLSNSVANIAAKMAMAQSAAEGATESLKLQALAASLNADATLNLSAKLIQYQVASQTALKAQEKRIEDAAKIAKAAKDEGDAVIRITELMGRESETTRVTAEMKEKYAQAIAVEASERAEAVKILEQEIAVVEQNAKARNLDAQAVKDQTDKLKEKLNTGRAEAEQAKQSAEVARVEALQRRLTTETLGDQSVKLESLRAAQEAANREYTLALALKERGMATEKNVTDAFEKQAIAIYKVRDAEKDRNANAELGITAIRTGYQLTLAQYDLDKAKLNLAIDKARTDGDEYKLKKLLIEQKELEIKITRTTMDAVIAETKAKIAMLQIKKEEIGLDDPLRAQKIAAIDLSIQAAEADILRAKAAGEAVTALERELKTLKDGIGLRKGLIGDLRDEVRARNGAVSASRDHADAIDKLNMRYMQSSDYSEKQIALLEREAAAAEKAAEAYRKKWNIDKDGFTLDANGQRMQQSAPTQRYVFDTAKAQGLSEAEALALVDQFIRDGQPSSTSQGLGASKDWFTLVNEAINERVLSNARNRVNTGSNADGGQAVPSGTKTVVININGRQRKVDVATSADANTLAAVLRELEASGGTSS
ncbi:tape measure protein [Delftia sp. DT-2]|uniref:tape measure protein n=1 Tax=Delftia sp. DT-2 TaxID=3022772 RepID=UPI00233F2320|nr:tape measure protein [Delftia sp. DT-2]MDC2859053.1 tape measure protein [Delftia sp. DT-2]